MVDVKLTPQSFARTGGASLNTLQGAQLPSLRSIQSVRPSGAEATVNMFVNMATDSGSISALSGAAAEKQMAEIRTLQSLEKDKKVAQAQLAIQEGLTQLQTQIEDANEYPIEAKKLVDDITTKFLDDKSLSDFQREGMSQAFEKTKIRAAQSALEYKTELNQLSANFDIAEIMQTKRMLVYKNPNLADDVATEMESLIDDYGTTLTELDRAKLKQQSREELGKARIFGEINADPFAASARIKSGAYSDVLTVEQTMQMQNMADAEVNSRKSKYDAEVKRVRKAEYNNALSAIVQQYSGGVNEDGEPITIGVQDIAQNSNLMPDQKLGLIKAMGQLQTDAGNPRLAAELSVKLRTGEIDVGDVVSYSNAETSGGEKPLSHSELSSIVKVGEDPLPPGAKQLLQNINERINGLPDIPGAESIKAELRWRALGDVENAVIEAKQSGHGVHELFRAGNPNSKNQHIIDSVVPSQVEYMKMIYKDMGGEVEEPKPKDGNSNPTNLNRVPLSQILEEIE